MAEELDLNNPSHLAALLRAALPGFEEHTADHVAPHVEALAKSDHPAFDHVGVAERVDPHQPDQPKQLEPEPQEQLEPHEEPDQQEPHEPQPWEQQPWEQQPLDMGGEGQALEMPPVETETAGPPIFARRSWTEIDRQRSKGLHVIYRLEAKHTRSEPIRSEFTGRCQSVRVSLPRQKPPADAFIGTWIGTVEAKDHLAFSIEEIEQMYERAFNRERKLQRVDLITGARFRGRRFSPISIYLGYCAAAGKPDFYFLESGSASGKPQVMYCARHLDDAINKQSGFRFTPFACATNWYEGGLALSTNKREPACVYLTVSQGHNGEHQYLRLSVTYERDLDMRRVIHPFELQIEAALRVLAIADRSGCPLERGEGKVLEQTLGPLLQALIPWDERPFGNPTASERARFCGCPK